MKPSQYMELIKAIEAGFPVSKWEMKGIHVWPLIRLDLAGQLLLEEANKPTGASSHTRSSGIAAKLSALFTDLYGLLVASVVDARGNARIREKVDAVFLTYTTDRIDLGGKYYNRLSDPLVELMQSIGMSSFTLEKSTAQQYRVPRYHGSKYIQLAVIMAHFRSMLACKFSKPLDSRLDHFEDFCGYLRTQGYDRLIPDLREISRQIHFVNCMKTYYLALFGDLKPKIAVATDIYSLEGMALCLACRECDIPSVDIQHGLQGDLSRSYSSWTNVPPDGYELLPSIYWNWSENEARVINDWNAGIRHRHRSVVGGNLWLNKWLDSDWPIVKEYDDKILSFKKALAVEKFILFSLQGCDVPHWIFDAIISTPKNWVWMFKLHPCYEDQRQQIVELAKTYTCNNVEIELANDIPLFALLRNVDIHITGWSSVVVDAESFGVPSIITEMLGEDIYLDNIKAGTTATAYNPEQLIERIAHFFTMARNRADCYNTRVQQSIDALKSIQKQSGHYAEEAKNFNNRVMT